MKTIKRDILLEKIRKAFKVHRIVCLLGPKGSGKSALADSIAKEFDSVNYFDLETLPDLRALSIPDLSLEPLRGLIIIKSIERNPEFFAYLRYLHDRHFDQKLLILSSFDQGFIKQSSETLAGRIEYVEISPFSLNEVQDFKKLWVRGGLPKSYLSNQDNSFL